MVRKITLLRGKDLAKPMEGIVKKNSRIQKAEYERLASFRYALRQFLRFSEKAARANNLTPQQHQALLAIKGFPGRERITLGELAERLQIRHHSTVELVNRLEIQRFVVREQAEEDRRQVYVALTPSANEILEQLAAVHKEELRRIGPQLHLLLQDLTGVENEEESEVLTSLTD